MQLVTKEIERKLPPLRSTENSSPENVDVVVKFFAPWTGLQLADWRGIGGFKRWTWYATEGEKTPSGDWMFYGLVDGFESELGQWMRSELEQITGPMGWKIERDRGFTAKLSEVM